MVRLDWLKKKLKRQFERSDLEELHYCFNVDFIRNREPKTIRLSQSKYIKKVLKQLNIKDCKPSRIFLEANLKLMKLIDEKYVEVEHQMQGSNKLTHLCNGGHNNRSCICGQCYKPKHGKTKPYALENYQDDYGVLKILFEPQTMSKKRQNYIVWIL
jgi:hypothetical protein